MTFAYWKDESRVAEYLFTYFFLEMALERHPETECRIPYVNSDYCYLMLRSLQDEYEEKKFQHILELSGVHKLTYKLRREVLENKNNIYHKIVEGSNS